MYAFFSLLDCCSLKEGLLAILTTIERVLDENSVELREKYSWKKINKNV